MTLLAYRLPASAPATVLGQAPRLTTTVPKEYVHRACHAEVFLTGCRQQDDTTFTVTAQWPRAHTFFTSPDGVRHDPLQTAETVRQVGLYLAHTQFGVPLDHHFLMWDLGYTTRPRQLSIGAAPTDLTITAEVTAQPRKTRTTVDFMLTTTLLRGDHVAATGYTKFTTVPPATYRRLRGPQRAAHQDPHPDPLAPPMSQPMSQLTSQPMSQPEPMPLAPGTVGRIDPRDVILAPTGEPDTWRLTPNPRHPILFDHANDHIPGMVLLEAARQATNALTTPTTITPTGAAITYHRYAEHDQPTVVTARFTPGDDANALVTTVTGHQGGELVFTTVITGSPEHT
ncbi:ScbA/BarX family gamma-butyrolactone biosynthesis protein [Kitasatospora sp. NPDC058170]|uniref:ScbA/BarX family gamma-butyrolactone biosynthesis protein n=1 Tax=Kitasatospora sp. NPDC058170 TaxID=3346364 RepID=UPI0036D76652